MSASAGSTITVLDMADDDAKSCIADSSADVAPNSLMSAASLTISLLLTTALVASAGFHV
jgi:hypothetical protein